MYGDKKQASFQSAIKYTVLIGQYFGLNPVFYVWSRRSIYSALSICAQGLVFILCVLNVFKETRASLSSIIQTV
ncbi:unnamed protein product [Leptidea sinapis]|uniref:Uncharacterized protein n=1 Tax=Leptidea sinapis TaxID=189913 RepID=A0A5E4RA36_9NEOP|nr:unnamed protein product [Leptidea sinapis]